jgi:hypothetical protein
MNGMLSDLGFSEEVTKYKLVEGVNFSNQIDISDLSKGIYFVKFMVGNQMVVRKVVKDL